MLKIATKRRSLFVIDIMEQQANNFNLLKLFAALGVIIGATHELPSFMVEQVGNLSTLSLNFFFFLSGLLTTNSVIQKPEPWWFLARRFLRIFPALMVCLLISAFLIGPLWTQYSLGHYLSHEHILRYFFSHLSLSLDLSQLPGVLPNDALASNTVFIALHYLAICYLYTAVFSGLGFFTMRIVANLGCIAFIFIGCILPEYMFHFTEHPGAIMFAICFLIGAFFAMNKQILRVDLSRTLLTWLWMWLFNDPIVQHILFHVAFFYTMLYVASRSFVNKLKLPFDASLGVCLYGALIEPCMHALYPSLSTELVYGLSLSLALVMGIASWYLFERKAISWGQKRDNASIKYNEPAYAISFVKAVREKVLKEKGLLEEFY